jgi:uncharacterized protein (TIGR02145 family)
MSEEKFLLILALVGILALSIWLGKEDAKQGVEIDGVTWATGNVTKSGKMINSVTPGEYYDYAEAQTACPDGWRLPTREELQSLADTDSRWEGAYGRKGRIFGTSKNIVFLRAAGEMADRVVKGRGTEGVYWSSTPNHGLRFDESGVSATSLAASAEMETGRFPVRCVKEAVKPLELEFDENGVVVGGITWATCNVGEPGQFVARPGDTGKYYSYEEAQTVCPTGWRLPTRKEMNALVWMGTLGKGDSRWATVNGIPGRLFESGGNAVFLPAALSVMFRANNGDVLWPIDHVGGQYWAAVPARPSRGYYLFFNQGAADTRTYGFSLTRSPMAKKRCSVRCVRQ